jgi:hypothetical protein
MGDGAEVTAAHTGYRRLRGEVMHRRTVSREGAVFRVSDEVTGSGRHQVESFIHFHPAMNVSLEAVGLKVTGPGIEFAVRFTGGVRARLGRLPLSRRPQGWYYSEFGLRRSSPVVLLTHEGALPARIGYEIHPLNG